MVKEILIHTQFLQEGMELARDIEADGILLVAKGTILTAKMVRQFIHNKIFHVWINEEIHTENFKIYQQNYEAFDKLVKMVRDDKPIDMEQITDIVEKFSNTHSYSSLLKYINGIRKVDHYTYQHSLNVCYLAMMLAKWSGSNPNDAALAGLCHDLGKIKVGQDILNKPGDLTEEEWREVKRHSFLGYDILLQSGDLSKEVLAAVLYHHERSDGTGYPQGLKGDKIPELARILAIVDVFDALTSDRSYRDKKDFFEVLQFMHNQYQEFDLRLLRIFTEHMLDILVGEQVLLSNNQVGRIVFKNPYRPFSPLIQTEDGFIDLSKTDEIKIARMF